MAHINNNSKVVTWVQPQKSPHIYEIGKKDFLPSLLHRLLSLATPSGTESHIAGLILGFIGDGFPHNTDEKGNLIVTVGENPTTMFSSHMDTVHNIDAENLKQGIPGHIRLLTFDPKAPVPDTQKGFIYAGVVVPNKNKSDTSIKYESLPLGADDKVGVYLMALMIKNKIPGLYIFHTGEEVGGKGSEYITTKTPDVVDGIKRAIAFDRKGYNDVIAHQRGGRCASIEFTNLVAAELNKYIRGKHADFIYKGDQHGTFTDTANYRKLIPECINISCGYFAQHTDNEKFDWDWFARYFMPAVLKIKWDDIPVTRDHTANDYVVNNNYYGGDYHGYTGYWDNQQNKYINNDALSIKVAPQDITRQTPYARIPAWNPEEGYIVNASSEGMERVIDKWLCDSRLLVPRSIERLLQRLMLAELNVELLQEEIKLLKLSQPKELDAQIEDIKKGIEELKKEDVKKEVIKKEGMPANEQEFIAHVSIKRVINDAFVELLDNNTFKIMGQMTYNESIGIKKHYSGICNVLKRKEFCSDTHYKQLNHIIWGFVEAFTKIPEKQQTEAVQRAVRNAIRYIRSNADQPGFEKAKRDMQQAAQQANEVVT